MPQQRSRNRQSLLLASRNLYATFTNQSVQAAIGARHQTMRSSLLQYLQAFCVAGIRVHEEQILANRSREKLGVLSDKTDLFAKHIQIHAIRRDSVVQN